jgi:nucleotide-binding universal stress UspA family protein
MILICYDGSADARAAVEHGAELFKDEAATVLTVWKPFVDVIMRTSIGFGSEPPILDAEEMDEGSRRSADQTAAEGAELARKLGMSAEARICAQTTTTARAILAEADKLGADIVVMGSRGLTGIKSLLGSVSHELIQHADRTVAIVPSPDVAASRARELREQHD